MQGHIGASLGAIGIVTAIIGAAMAGLGAPWWAWTCFVLWGVLWVTAASGLSDEASRKFLAGTLRKSTFTQIYTTLARRNVMGIWTRLCDPAPDGASVGAFFRAALTWRLYDFALRLAVAYPILLLVGQWIVTGDEGRVGSVIVLSEAQFWPDRASVIPIILFVTAGAVGGKLASASQRPALNKAAGWLFNVSVGFAVVFALLVSLTIGAAFGLAIAVSGAAALSGAFALAGAFIVAFAFAATFALADAFVVASVSTGPLAFALAFASLLAVVFALAVSIAISVAFDWLDSREKQRLARVILTAAVGGALLIVTVSLDWARQVEARRSVFLFLAVLPLINALFDLVSYALTLSLIRRGLRSGLPFLWGLADLGLACGLLLGLGAVLVALIHGLNLLAGVPFLDLPSLFAGVQADPGAYVWLYLMLFSTLLPTLLHGVLSLLGVQGIWPRKLRRPVAAWVDAAPASPLHSIRASLGLSMIWALPLLALAGVLWLIWHYAQPALVTGLQIYLDGLLWIAAHPVGAL